MGTLRKRISRKPELSLLSPRRDGYMTTRLPYVRNEPSPVRGRPDLVLTPKPDGRTARYSRQQIVNALLSTNLPDAPLIVGFYKEGWVRVKGKMGILSNKRKDISLSYSCCLNNMRKALYRSGPCHVSAGAQNWFSRTLDEGGPSAAQNDRESPGILRCVLGTPYGELSRESSTSEPLGSRPCALALRSG